MKKYLFSVLFSTFLGADNVGGEASIGLYHHTVEGSSRYETLTPVELSDTLGFASAQDIVFNLYIEHPLLLFPNVKIGHTTLSQNTNKAVSALTWGNIQNFTGKTQSSLSLNYTDITLYYELMDSETEIDAGFTFRSLKGDMNIDTPLTSDSVSYSTLVPLLYGKVRFNIPSTDLSLQAEANVVSFSGLTSYDYAFSARYSFVMGLGVEAGYKTLHLESDDLVDRLDANLDFTGPYLLAIWDF